MDSRTASEKGRSRSRCPAQERSSCQIDLSHTSRIDRQEYRHCSAWYRKHRNGAKVGGGAFAAGAGWSQEILRKVDRNTCRYGDDDCSCLESSFRYSYIGSEWKLPEMSAQAYCWVGSSDPVLLRVIVGNSDRGQRRYRRADQECWRQW